MINNAARIVALVLLFMIILVKDIPYIIVFKNAAIQLYLAVVVIFILMAFDNLTGFLLALCLLVIYFKIYEKELKKKNEKPNVSKDTKKCSADKPCSLEDIKEHYKNDDKNNTEYDRKHVSQLPYTSEEHLIAAQNNIYCTDDYNKEVFGIEKGLNNENVYGVQGLDNKGVHMKGYAESVLGHLHYALLEE